MINDVINKRGLESFHGDSVDLKSCCGIDPSGIFLMHERLNYILLFWIDFCYVEQRLIFI